jgi:hypothetical protein
MQWPVTLGLTRRTRLVFASRATPFIRVGARPHPRHSHKIVVKESVQGLSNCGGIRTVVGMEASASNERLDFALAKFDTEEPQPPASTFAVPKHTSGRRRARQLFCGRRQFYCPWIMIGAPVRRGEIWSLSTRRKYQNFIAAGIGIG